MIQDEVQYEEDNRPDLSEQTNYFENAGWNLSHNNTQIMLSKSNGPYQLRLLFNARTPLSQDTQEDQQNQNPDMDQPGDEDYAEISAYVSKDGKKWLCAEFMIVNNECHMSMANFVEDFEAEKAERLKSRMSTAKYQGPELGSLESTLLDNITVFLETVGIDNTVLVHAADYSVSFEHKFYVEWLKNFETLC